jgi:1-deoxy-D-xylulose-5-phosphate synthase
MGEVVRGDMRSSKKKQTGTANQTRDAGVRSPATNLLSRITGPQDLKTLSRGQLRQLCGEIREFIVDVVSQKGGHLGPSLGVVELSVALARVLDQPRDRVVWDTGHQAYVHKVLTGRRDDLWSIRQYGGISGFLKRDENPYDAFGAGHASTAISAARGLAAARDLAGLDHRVVAVIGDGAMTGGLAYEAMNNAGQAKRPLLVILNDNGMSIAPNVGAIAHYLTQVTSNPSIKKVRDDSIGFLKKLPALGESMGAMALRMEKAIKTVLVPGGLFEALGFGYIGPVDGHDLDQLLDLLPKILQRKNPVLLHVITKKGKGLAPAEKDFESFHGVTPFDKETGKALSSGDGSGPPAYTKVFGQSMLEAAEAFPRMVAISAAMPTGTGLTEFKAMYRDRFFDVGIAEAHAVCFSAGLACDGARPVVAIYSTFLQRAFDQIVHDVALQRLPVVFALDRGGLVGADGPTHHGVLDLSYLRCIPNMVVAAPRNGNELRDLIWTGLEQSDGPFAIRFPRGPVPAGYDPNRAPERLTVGSWEILAEGSDVVLLAVGTMVESALEARSLLAARGVSAEVVNCRFIKPMDRALLHRLRAEFPVLVTVEENSLVGGFGDGVLEELEAERQDLSGVVRLGLPDRFVTHGTRAQLLDEVGLTATALADAAQTELGRKRS